jgi:hypothetical protein
MIQQCRRQNRCQRRRISGILRSRISARRQNAPLSARLLTIRPDFDFLMGTEQITVIRWHAEIMRSGQLRTHATRMHRGPLY